ncbi:hypothetical protein Ctob_015819 [Chrysochromulina tobinii]|uniref:DUF4326 domain-containing protein n=1 Tax=Chrysochromulina tobinii TaxID=1460289 RepID=A0A0M0K5X5_9EUKA|nr:hypothetical protein Ctob_015819 [Chrysochromulina tobinii]|eukprot:KOO34225.1 hypothetical protein Ctob_015819 [Chrysochromulina sp. CCMP291]
MWAVHRSEVAELREVFSTPGPTLTATEADRLAGPLATGFGDASGASELPCAPRELAAVFDAIWAADCPAWHARVAEADPDQIPLALREAGALASFTDDALAMAPFASRCRPPVTTGRPPPAGQRSGPPGPRSYEGFYPPGHFRSKADPWLLAQHAYLLDALEHGEACTVKPPKALLFSDHERLPEFRGRLYEYSTARDEYVLTDTSAPATTHLNLPFATQFSGDYPDRELFSTLEFGVDFDADNLEMQVVLPPHLLSLAGGLSKVQSDIAGRAGRGWYEVFDRMPFNPWRPQQMGSRPKPNGKYRVIVNASFPHSELADDYGVRTHSLNSLSKRSYDAVRGSDGKRMCRMLAMVRVTARSPPPHASDAVSPSAAAAFAPRLGKIRVERAEATHPWSVHGGAGSLLGTPFHAAGPDQQGAACDAYDVLQANPNRSAFTIAAEYGVKCNASQAKVSARARASLESVLAAGVARGRSLQLAARGPPGRSHLDSVAGRVEARARLLHGAQRVSLAAVGTAAKQVLHLFAATDALAEECRRLGVCCTNAGVRRGDELRDDVTYQRIMAEASAGVYSVVVATTSCSIVDAFSQASDEVTRRAVAIIVAACRRGAAYILEGRVLDAAELPLSGAASTPRLAISVGNLKTKGRAALPPPGTLDLRVDRMTAFGNPFPMGADERLRDAVCDACEELLEDPIGADLGAIAAKYQLCVDERFSDPTARSQLLDALGEAEARLRAGESLRLMCWCFPKRCHADGIAQLLRRRLRDAGFEGAAPATRHASPCWSVRAVIDLEKLTESREVRFNMCRLGGGCRMTTKILYSAGLARLDALADLWCGCRSPHAREFTSYPSRLTALIAATAADWVDRAQRNSRWVVGLALNPCVGVLSLSDDGPKRPPELKWYISEYMNDDAILKHVALIIDTFVVTLADDFADWFYQLKLMAGCYWMVGYILLELEKLAEQAPELRFVVEKVLGQGTVPGSNWGQRLCELVLHMWDVVFNVLDGAHTAAQRRDSPGLDGWFARREAAGLLSRLHSRGGYTDDTKFRFVGPERARRGAKAWCFVTKGFRTIMADASKRMLGVHDISLGTCFNYSLGIAFIEFAGFYGNCCKWGADAAVDELIVSEVDALVPAFVLTREASASPLMQHVLAAVNALEFMPRLREHMTIGHISSEVNVTADLPSRGRLAELISIAEHAGAHMTVEPHPSALDALLDELVQLELDRRPAAARGSNDDHVTDPMGNPRPYLTAAEQGLGGTRRDNTAKDGAAALTVRVPAFVEAPAASGPTPAPGPLRRDAQQAPGPVRHDRLTPYTRPKTERYVPSSAPGTVVDRLPVTSVVLPERCATTMELETVLEYTVTHRSATVESEANALDLLLPERTALKRLLNDSSQYALKPASASRLAHMCGAVHDATWDNAGSKAKLDSNMKLWRKYCDGLNTPCWRPGEAGLTPHEREREAILAANFLPYALTVMRGRRGCAQAKPASAYKAYLGVRKAHSKRTVELPGTKLVWQMCKRLNARHAADFGALSLVVKRKQPFTKEILHALLISTDKGALDLTVPAVAAAFRAFVATLRQTGMRKSELALGAGVTFTRALATRANLQWCLRGIIYADPPPDLLRHPKVGDYAILVPPPSKADPYGEVWGALPIYLHYAPSEPDAAFNHLATLELTVPAVGQQRHMVPLISADNKRPLAAGQLDRMLQLVLGRVVGKANASKYSWHSARIYLACSLLAAGASHAQIQALCRWQTEDSLRVYARLNPSSYDKLLIRAASADVHSVSVASLPPLSSELAIRQLLGLSLVDALAASA